MQSDKSGIIITLSKIILRQKQNPAEKVVRSQNVAPGSEGLLVRSINTPSLSCASAVAVIYCY